MITESPPSPPPPPALDRTRWPRVAFIAVLLFAAYWLVGQVFRDVTLLTALGFYIPSVVVAALLLLAAIIAVVLKRRRVGLLLVALGLIPFAVVLLLENRFVAPPLPQVPSDSARVVHWNICFNLDVPEERGRLRDLNADLYLITEQHQKQYVEQFRDELGPGYAAVSFGTMAAVGREALVDDGDVLEGRRLTVRKLTWTHRGQSSVVLFVDLPSEPWVSRDPLLRQVCEAIVCHRPDFVLGDFNAPRRSRALTELPPGYVHAYDAVGRGWGSTWPQPVPMYALDQCVLSDRVVPLRYTLHPAGSDHLIQVLDFQWRK